MDTTNHSNLELYNVRSASNIPDYVQWQALALCVACFASSTSSTALLGNPDTITTVLCTAPASEPTNGSLLVSADNRLERNATIKFVVYEHCAAVIYAFYYESSFAIACAGDLESSVTCLSKGMLQPASLVCNTCRRYEMLHHLMTWCGR
jgi:hypothetical protein